MLTDKSSKWWYLPLALQHIWRQVLVELLPLHVGRLDLHPLLQHVDVVGLPVDCRWHRDRLDLTSMTNRLRGLIPQWMLQKHYLATMLIQYEKL